MSLTQAERDDLVYSANTSPKTLDGRPAMICGRLERFATVWAFGDKPGQTIQVEFAWETVKYIVDNKNGVFFTY